MRKEMNIDFEGYGNLISLDIPNICPHCQMTMQPQIISNYVSGNYDSSVVSLVLLLQCTNDKCLRFFSAEYLVKNDRSQLYDATLRNFAYMPFTTSTFSDKINKLSSMFVKIYNEAEQAEQLGLSEIFGMGYRKALEFLIKDFLITEIPNDSADGKPLVDKEKYINQVKKDNLGKNISEKLSMFTQFQHLAKAANWIGTDSTHYETRYTDSDVESMKNYIKSAVSFIQGYLYADEAEKFTNDSK